MKPSRRKTTRRRTHKGVKIGYSCHRGLVGNRARLAAFVKVFDIPIQAIARHSGYARSYIARCLSPRDELRGSSEFWYAVEQALGTLVKNRRRPYFSVVPERRAADTLARIGQL